MYIQTYKKDRETSVLLHTSCNQTFINDVMHTQELTDFLSGPLFCLAFVLKRVYFDIYAGTPV